MYGRSEGSTGSSDGLAALLGQIERVGDCPALRSAGRRDEDEHVGAGVDDRDASGRRALRALGLSSVSSVHTIEAHLEILAHSYDDRLGRQERAIAPVTG